MLITGQINAFVGVECPQPRDNIQDTLPTLGAGSSVRDPIPGIEPIVTRVNRDGYSHARHEVDNALRRHKRLAHEQIVSENERAELIHYYVLCETCDADASRRVVIRRTVLKQNNRARVKKQQIRRHETFFLSHTLSL